LLAITIAIGGYSVRMTSVRIVSGVANQELERRSIDTIRTLAMDAVQQANAGHPGTAMALAPLAYVLYRETLRISPSNPGWPDRDRFVLSAGHACILQYASLHLTGYALPLEELKRFRQWQSLTPGHPEHFITPGVETTTGPLGQGFANGVGFGVAERFLGERYNRPHHQIVDHRVYAICSDGDLMEGVSSEAASIAGGLGLGKLVYFYDDNRITIDGTTALSFDSEDKGRRFEAYGWQVQHVADVNDLDALRGAIAAAQAETERPSLIIVRSHIAFPAPHAQDTAKAHGAPLGEEEVRETKEVLGWDPDEHFVVPDEVREHMNRIDEGIELEQEWNTRFERWATAFPALREDWVQVHTGKPRPGFADALPEFPAGEDVATRDAGKKVMQAVKSYLPTMIGGAADLVESTKTEFEGGGIFSPSYAGRNIAFGIREHGMGSIVNGIALHGGMVKPYGSTFLIFSDYMRPAVRLSALMHLPVVWAWTHDSVGLGEDGPTHQPVEHYAALRAIPNLWFVRPADANETAHAWKVALEREDGPVALSLTRQKVPTLDRAELGPASGLERGAYVLWDSGGEPDLILIATGSEVWLALEAARKISGENGTSVRVVSMPCWELFELQTPEYREEVFPSDVRARLAVEAGVALGWKQWVGDHGDSISLNRFGASAPGTTVLERLGYNLDNVVAKATALLERVT
jgi:transketolase